MTTAALSPNTLAISRVLALRQDPHPTPDYRVCRTPADLNEYLYETPNITIASPAKFNQYVIAEDTESTPDRSAYCVTFSISPGTGRLIYRHDSRMMDAYRKAITTTQYGSYLHLFHNYLHDVTVFDQLDLPIGDFLDTMVIAYELCLGGGGDGEEGSMAGRGYLGLKHLANRYLNMSMTSFQDTVYPHSWPRLKSYLESIATCTAPTDRPNVCECGHSQTRHARRGKTERHIGGCLVTTCPCLKCKLVKWPNLTDDERQYGFLHRKAKNLLTDTRLLGEEEDEDLDYTQDPGTGPIDPWKRIGKWHDHDHRIITELARAVPRPSIADVPEPELLQYAVRDADATLRLYLHLESLITPPNSPWLFW